MAYALSHARGANGRPVMEPLRMVSETFERQIDRNIGPWDVALAECALAVFSRASTLFQGDKYLNTVLLR